MPTKLSSTKSSHHLLLAVYSSCCSLLIFETLQTIVWFLWGRLSTGFPNCHKGSLVLTRDEKWMAVIATASSLLTYNIGEVIMVSPHVQASHQVHLATKWPKVHLTHSGHTGQGELDWDVAQTSVSETTKPTDTTWNKSIEKVLTCWIKYHKVVISPETV